MNPQPAAPISATPEFELLKFEESAPPAVTGPLRWTVRFWHQGRRYTLYKRVDSETAPYGIHIQRDRKRQKISLGSADVATATARAKIVIEATLEEKWQSVARFRKCRGEVSLHDLFKVYDKLATDIAPRTRRNNVLSMTKVIERVSGSKPEPKNVYLARIDKNLAVNFQELTAKAYCVQAEKDETSQREARERAYRTSKSTLNQARSLFSQRAENDILQKYKDGGLKIPDCVKEFTTCSLRGSLSKTEYNIPSDDVIQKAFADIENFKDKDTELYLAFWLAVGAGLRRGEIAKCDWSHLVERNGVLWVVGGLGKDGFKIEVPLQARAARSLSPFRQPAGRIIKSSRWAKRLSTWMRECGWRTEKTLHELRAYIGSKIFERDPQAAMRFLRHKDLTTTQTFYGRYVHGLVPIDVL